LEEIRQDPGHKVYLQVLKTMTPEVRLLKAFELHDFATELFKHGLRERFPDATEDELRAIYLERIEKCHNRNY